MRQRTAAVIAALCLASTAGAQDRPLVTEAEFLAAIGEDHPAVAALRRGPGLAEADAIGARTLAAPELEAAREAPGAARQVDVTLRWQPPRPGRRRLSIAAAEAGVESARARYELERLGVLQAAREVFARWAVESSVADVLSRQVTALDALGSRERERARAGEVSGLEANRVALAAARARNDLARASAERGSAFAAARAWVPDLALNATPELPALPATTAAEPAVHPRIAELLGDLERAQLDERVAGKVADVPAVVAGWQRQEVGADSADGPILGLSWPLPLVDRGRARRLAARARADSLDAELALAEREIEAARESALRSYQELRLAAEEAARLAGGTGPLVEAASAAFAAGETDVTDLLDTVRSSTEFEVDALRLRAEALAAQRRLASALASSVDLETPPRPAAGSSGDASTTNSPRLPGDTP